MTIAALVFPSLITAQISETISEACKIRTENSMPGDLVYFWYTNGGKINYSTVPLTSKKDYPAAQDEHYDVNLNGEVGFCFVPNDINTKDDTFSAMVIKEALVGGRQVINDNIYLTIGDAVGNYPVSWDAWQRIGTDTSSSELRSLNSLLRGVSLGKNSTIVDFRSNLFFSNEFKSEEIKRTVDIIRWRNSGNLERIHWYHSPRDRANKFASKILEVFVVQQLAPNDLPRTFVIRFAAVSEK